METDSSDFIIGGILSQYNNEGILHPIAFYSKTIVLTKYNYYIYDKELLVIIRYFEH